SGPRSPSRGPDHRQPGCGHEVAHIVQQSEYNELLGVSAARRRVRVPAGSRRAVVGGLQAAKQTVRGSMKTHAGKSQEEKTQSPSSGKPHLLQSRPFRGQEEKKQSLSAESPRLPQLRPFREMAGKNALATGIGREIDTERHADVVADTVAAGQSVQRTRNVVQLVRYRGRQESKPGVTPAVQVAASLDELRIEDETQTDQSIGDLSGVLNYRIRKKDREVYLDHIETHPPGLGLGALLMYELALKAEAEGCVKISISMPAHTAVGAYLLFGALPERPAAADVRFGQFFTSYTEDQAGEDALSSTVETEVREKVKQRM